MPSDLLRYEDFAPHVGSAFLLEADPAPLPLDLAEATPLRHAESAARAPFSLLFRARSEAVLPQRQYHLRHAAMGELDIFLVPIASAAGSVTYEAIFS